jgi:hypothetical protein
MKKILASMILTWILIFMALNSVENEYNFDMYNNNVIYVNIPITDYKGEIQINNVGKFFLKEDARVKFEVVDVRVPDGVKISLNGMLILNGNIIINMPCMVSKGIECYRIMIIIPGYDEPIILKRGVYEVSIRVSWTSSVKDINVSIGIAYLKV